MNKEIKEILDRLERIDHKENKTAFEFADSGTFDEVARCFEERKKMADYITNLEQENYIVQTNIEILKNKIYGKDEYIEILEKSKEDYKSRIDKAIEYIKEYVPIINNNLFTKEHQLERYKEKEKYNEKFINELLNILNGDDE